MFDCSLQYPDEPWWADEEDYSSNVGILLTEAYATIERGNRTADAYRRAKELLDHWRDESMSRRQRMHVYYVIALANDAIGHNDEGLAWIDRALSLSLDLRSDYDQGELLSRRASMNRSGLFLASAAEDARDCLAIIDEHEGDLTTTEINAARIQLLPQLAMYEFFIADFDATKLHIAEARKLIAQTPDMALAAAANEWVQANLDRLNRRPELALRPSIQICEIYAREGSAISRERAEILLAQSGLEFAESLPPGTDRHAMVALALPHIEQAEVLASMTFDKPGQALCELLRAHYDRLTGSNSNRVSRIAHVIQFADDIYDIAVSAQAHIMLGHEFAALGEIERAKICYQSTLDLVSGSEVPALGIPAQRALIEQAEFTPTEEGFTRHGDDI